MSKKESKDKANFFKKLVTKHKLFYLVEAMRFEILLSFDKLQLADLEFDSKAVQI